MQRIYYLGKEPSTDPRLAGVELEYLMQIDVPEDLAEILVGEAVYADLPGPPVVMPEEPAPSDSDIRWYEPEPGVELTALSGVSESRAGWLVEYGIATLADMSVLSHNEITSLADEMPRIGRTQVRGWVRQANQLL